MAENVGADDSALKVFAHVERLARRFTPGRIKLCHWLNKYLKIEMTDGRILVGIFFCTDQARNVILGNCSEYLRAEDIANNVEPRMLGLAMVPGHHIVTIHVDNSERQ